MTKRWRHVALAWDEETKRLDFYIDYVKQSSAKTGADFDPSAAHGYFGSWVGGTSNGFYGKLACIRLTQRRLNPEDMMVVAKDEGYDDDKTFFHWTFEDASSKDFAAITETAAHPKNVFNRRGATTHLYSCVPAYSNVVDRPYAAYTRQGRSLLATNSLSAYFYGYSSQYGSNVGAGSHLYMNTSWDSSIRPASFTLEMFARRDLAAGESVGFSSSGQLLAVYGNRTTGASELSTTMDFCVVLPAAAPHAITFRQYDSAGTLKAVMQGGSLEDGNWHHLAWTYDNTTYTYCQYVDYKLVATYTDEKPLQRTTSSNFTWMFGRGVGYGGFLGWMDDIRVSNCVRPVSEFLRHRGAPQGAAIILR